MLKPLTVRITINWKILKEIGLLDHFACLLRNLYAGQEATVRTGHGTTDWFQIGKGIHQGCLLSPCLFNFYAEWKVKVCVWLCDPRDYSPWNSSGQNTGVGKLTLLQGLFQTQGSNPCLLLSCTAGGVFTHWTTWEARWISLRCLKIKSVIYYH